MRESVSTGGALDGYGCQLVEIGVPATHTERTKTGGGDGGGEKLLYEGPYRQCTTNNGCR